MLMAFRKNNPVVGIQDLLLEYIIVPVFIFFFSVTVMFLNRFFPDSISGTYLQLFF